MGNAAGSGTELVLRGEADVAQLRERVRAAARRLSLPVLQAARIVLAASEAGSAALRHDRAPSAAVRVHHLPEAAVLVVDLVATRGDGPLPSPEASPPVTAHGDRSGTLRLRLAAPASGSLSGTAFGSTAADDPTTGDGPEEYSGDDAPELERELRAAVADADDRSDLVQRLNEELEETNQGVVALYVELEQRDEQLRRAHREVFRELENALRPPPPEAAGIELGVAYLPAQEDAPTGGDLYDWLVLPTGELHVTVVDVLGHGVTGTRDALSVTHTIRTLTLDGHPFPNLIEHAASLLEDHNPDLMATVVLARFDPATGRLQVASGSHPPVLAADPGAEPYYVTARGRGLGYPEPGSESVATVELAPHGLVLLYTDGLVESTHNIIEGMDRLRNAVSGAAGLPTAEIPEAVVDRMLAGGAHTDDTLAISLRWTPEQPECAPTPGGF